MSSANSTNDTSNILHYGPVTEQDFRLPEFRGADPADYERRPDGRIVRKDRWEVFARNVARHFCSDPGGFELDLLAKWFSEFVESARAAGVEPLYSDDPPLMEADRRRHACKVCGNEPDRFGALEHGKGCYTQSEDGGGTSYVG